MRRKYQVYCIIVEFTESGTLRFRKFKTRLHGRTYSLKVKKRVRGT